MVQLGVHLVRMDIKINSHLSWRPSIFHSIYLDFPEPESSCLVLAFASFSFLSEVPQSKNSRPLPFCSASRHGATLERRAILLVIKLLQISAWLQ